MIPSTYIEDLLSTNFEHQYIAYLYGKMLPSTFMSLLIEHVISFSECNELDDASLFGKMMVELGGHYGLDGHMDEEGGFDRKHLRDARLPAKAAYLAAIDEAFGKPEHTD